MSKKNKNIFDDMHSKHFAAIQDITLQIYNLSKTPSANGARLTELDELQKLLEKATSKDKMTSALDAYNTFKEKSFIEDIPDNSTNILDNKKTLENLEAFYNLISKNINSISNENQKALYKNVKNTLFDIKIKMSPLVKNNLSSPDIDYKVENLNRWVLEIKQALTQNPTTEKVEKALEPDIMPAKSLSNFEKSYGTLRSSCKENDITPNRWTIDAIIDAVRAKAFLILENKRTQKDLKNSISDKLIDCYTLTVKNIQNLHKDNKLNSFKGNTEDIYSDDINRFIYLDSICNKLAQTPDDEINEKDYISKMRECFFSKAHLDKNTDL